MDPRDLQNLKKALNKETPPPPAPPPEPAPALSEEDIAKLRQSLGLPPKEEAPAPQPAPRPRPAQKPTGQVSGAQPKRDPIQKLAEENLPERVVMDSAPYYLARPTGNENPSWVPVLSESTPKRAPETRYDPMGVPYEVDPDGVYDTTVENRADMPVGEQPLSVAQALGLSDRSTSVKPSRDAFTESGLEQLTGPELVAIILDQSIDKKVRDRAQYFLSKTVPGALQSTPEDSQSHTASPFVNDIETSLKNLRVDPMYLVGGGRADRDEPAKMLADLQALYRKRLIMTAPGKNYTSDLDVPKEELAAIDAKATEMARKKYKEIAHSVGGFNLVRMDDAQEHIDNARKNAVTASTLLGSTADDNLLSPFFAALSPGVYTVEDVYSTQPGHPVVRHEGVGAFSMRAPISTAIGSWLFNPESTWEIGGKNGWGGEQHLRDITYGYQLGDSMEHMRDVVQGAMPNDPRFNAFNRGIAHALVDIPTLGIMMVEPDMYTVPSLMTMGTAKLARPIVTGVNTAGDILKELRGLKTAVEAVNTADELDDIIRAASAEPLSTKATAARSVYAETQNYIADTASGVPLSEANPLHDVSNATLRKLKAGDIDEPGEFIPAEVKQIGQQHAKVDRVADISGARADELDNAYQVMRSQAMLDDMNVRDVINDIDRLAGNSDASALHAELATARVAADVAAGDIARIAEFNMARMNVENIDMPGMIRTGNFRQVLAQLYRNRGELFSILRKAGDGFAALDPAQQAARIADLQAKVAAAKRTLIDNVGDIGLAKKVAEYAQAQDTIAKKTAEIGKKLKEHAKAAGKGTARVTPDQVADARKAVGRLQKTWERIDDLALRQHIARRVHIVSVEMYKPLLLKAIDKHIEATERFIANGGAAKQKEVGTPIYASIVNDADELDIDKYIDELQTRLGKDVVETQLASPIGKILDELAGRANKSGPLVKLSGSDFDRLQLFEDAVHAENFRVEKLGPQARAEVMLNTVKEWKDLGGKAWKNVLEGKESLSTPLFQLYHRLTRRFDAAGGSDVGHMSSRLQEHVRRTLDRGRAVSKEIDEIGLGSKHMAPTDGGTQLTGLDAVEEFITTKRRYGAAIWNQGDLTLHQRGFIYLRSILDTDFAADNVIVNAIAGAPAASFDPVARAALGDAIRALKTAIKNSANADEAVQLAKRYVTTAILRQKGKTDSDEVVRHIVARAFAYAAVQYESALDFQRLFGPGISSESARLLNWMMSPATGNLALGSADAAFNTAAHLGLPLKGDMRGEWRRAFGVLAESRAVTTELVKRAQFEGYGLFMPAAVRTALHEENLKLAKEMTEFSRNNKNSLGSLMLRAFDHLRFQSIFGWIPHFWLPFGNLFGGGAWIALEKGGGQRAGQFIFSNAPAMVPWVGLRTPSGGPGLQQVAYETAAAHSVATRVFNPTVAKFLFRGDLDEVVALPSGERTTIGRLLREAEEDGTNTFLNSDEMRNIIRESRRRRLEQPKPSDELAAPGKPQDAPEGPPDSTGIPGTRLDLDPMDAPNPSLAIAKYEETAVEPDITPTPEPSRTPETIVPPTPAPGVMDSVPLVRTPLKHIEIPEDIEAGGKMIDLPDPQGELRESTLVDLARGNLKRDERSTRVVQNLGDKKIFWGFTTGSNKYEPRTNHPGAADFIRGENGKIVSVRDIADELGAKAERPFRIRDGELADGKLEKFVSSVEKMNRFREPHVFSADSTLAKHLPPGNDTPVVVVFRRRNYGDVLFSYTETTAGRLREIIRDINSRPDVVVRDVIDASPVPAPPRMLPAPPQAPAPVAARAAVSPPPPPATPPKMVGDRVSEIQSKIVRALQESKVSDDVKNDLAGKLLKWSRSSVAIDGMRRLLSPHMPWFADVQYARQAPDGEWLLFDVGGNQLHKGKEETMDLILGMLVNALKIDRKLAESGIDALLEYDDDLADFVNAVSKSLPEDEARRIIGELNPTPDAVDVGSLYSYPSDKDISSALFGPRPAKPEPAPIPGEPQLPEWMMDPDPIRELGEAETPPPWTLDMPPVARTATTAPPGGPGQPSVPPGWLNPPPAVAKAATPPAAPPRLPPPPPTPPTPPTPPSPAPGTPGSPGPGGTHSPLNVAKRAANALGMFIKGPWTEDFAKWVENLESRARLSYYVGLRLEGVDRMAARERLHRNLGNWTTGLSNSEAQFWGRYFSVYRWTRIKMRHMGETLAWSLTKPDVINPRDIVFNNTPLGRMTRMGKIRNNIPNLFDWGDSTDSLDDQEQFDAWGRRQLPWWEHSGVWLGARPALEWEKRMKTLTGRDVSFVEMMLISNQVLDELYLLNAFAQAGIATTLELAPFDTNYAGVGTGDDSGLAHALSKAAIDEFSRNVDKKWADATRAALNGIAGNQTPESMRGVLVPKDQHIAVKTIARLVPQIVDYGFIQENADGELRADANFWPMLELSILQLPMIDDLARATAHGVNVYNDPSLAHSLGLILGDYTSLYREVGFDPTKDHDYAVRERAAQLEKAIIRADRDVNSDDDRARRRSGQ